MDTWNTIPSCNHAFGDSQNAKAHVSSWRVWEYNDAYSLQHSTQHIYTTLFNQHLSTTTPRTKLNLQIRSETQLIRKSNGHLRMLQHMAKANRADRVLRGVDQLARVLKCSLNHKSRGVASLGRAGVVGACIAALSLDVGDCAVLYCLRSAGA